MPKTELEGGGLMKILYNLEEIEEERHKYGVKYCPSCKSLHEINYYCKDNQIRLIKKYRGGIYQGLYSRGKPNSFKSLVGLYPPEYREYIKTKFKDGMTWGNYGDWQIDHIKPCSLYNQENELDVKECYNYVNTQPLWASDNKRKGNRYIG